MEKTFKKNKNVEKEIEPKNRLKLPDFKPQEIAIDRYMAIGRIWSSVGQN